MEGKVCSKCGEWKELSEYYNRKSTKSGKMAWCKKCDKKKCKQYRVTSDYTKKYYKTNIERIKEYDKQHYQNNKEYYKEYSKQWYEQNKEYRKEYLKEYDKQRHEKSKKDNIEKMKNILGIKELKKLPIYGCVYKIKNIKTGRVYIGQTINSLKERYGSNIIKRWIKERLEKVNQKFIEELIEEDFVVTEVLDVACCEYHLNILEAYWIDYYDSYNNGYNNQQGNHNTDDGLEEFIEILQRYNLEFVDGQIVKKVN